ncbi:MAG: hypothetical protein ACC700_20625 [Anaerolineales bacterium]
MPNEGPIPDPAALQSASQPRAMLIGIPGMLAVILLQILLVAGVLPFANQIAPVVIAFLVALIWFIINGFVGAFHRQIAGPDAFTRAGRVVHRLSTLGVFGRTQVAVFLDQLFHPSIWSTEDFVRAGVNGR